MRTPLRDRWRPLLIAAAVLSGCGSSVPAGDNGEAARDPSTILADSMSALRQAGSAHLSGDIASSSSRIHVDVDVAGRDTIRGTFTIDGTPVRITTVGGNSYLSGRALWNKVDGSGRTAALFGDRCVLVPPTFPGAASILSGIAGISDLDTLATSLSQSAISVSRGPRSNVNGAPALAIHAGPSTVYVAARGRPYPLRIEMAGADAGHLDLSYGARPAVRAPGGCLDVSSLGTGGSG